MGHLGFLERGESLKRGGEGSFRKGGVLTPLPTMEMFFSCSDKELQKPRAKARKLGKRHWITTLWGNGP